MDLKDMLTLQGTIFALILIGTYMKKKGIVDDGGKRVLTDMCVNVVIPCNILKSFLSGIDKEVLYKSMNLFFAACVLQALCLILNLFIFNGFEDRRKKVLQYATIVPNSGLMGNSIAEGLYGSLGVLYTSIFLIPTRIVMWSMGTTYFVADAKVDKKKVLKNIVTHPCLVSVYLGIILMLTELQPPEMIVNTIRYVGNCNTALTMFIVGTILADVEPKSMLSLQCFLFSGFRLILLPAVALAIGLFFHVEGVPLGICVLMTGMPAGATTAIFAARYGSDAIFATRNVVLSTLLSMVTLPIWCMILG